MNLNLFDDGFSPDYGSSPGATLREVLDKLGLNQADLAERTGRPKKTINEIAQGKAAITPETALQFERVLGIRDSIWLNLERQFRSAQARVHERDSFREHVSWLSSFPVQELQHRGWVKSCPDRVELVGEVLAFFGVVSPRAWDDVWAQARKATAFRQRRGAKRLDFFAATAWLRKGEIQGRELRCESYDEAAFRDRLTYISGLTKTPIREAFTEVQGQCRSVGVAVVLVPEFSRVGVFGAARWLAPNKALIQLSLYSKREDQLWFSFFHEAAHVILHGRRDVFVDFEGAATDRQEAEANRFAQERLIPANIYNPFVATGNFSRSAILQFAKELDIDPGIVVGRLQHDQHLDWNQMTQLLRRVDWDSFK